MSSGSITADIKSIVSDLRTVSWEQVLFEAITNSIQANATEININFLHATLDVKDTNMTIEKIMIEDNGDGFNKKNTESFQKYRSDHKRHLGAKGIGRFLYLKVFEEIEIKSLNKNIHFRIDRDIEIQDIEEYFEKTVLFLNRPHKKLRIIFRELEQKIRDHFIAYFKLLTDEVKITIFENGVEHFVVSSREIPSFQTKIFKIHRYEFTLSYVFQSQYIKKYDGFYCAGGRVVIKNSELDSKKKLKNFYGMNILYLLSSSYLDENVNDERDDFKLMPVQTTSSLYDDLAWKDIHAELGHQLKIIALENNININNIAQERLDESRKNAPYLAYYLRDNENAIPSEELIKKAKGQLEEDKKTLRADNKKVEDYQRLLSIVTQSELAEYIFDREKLIKKLQNFTDEKSLEKEIHNLFMKQGTVNENEDYRSNNLWLFDDRFMSYDKVFSDKQIQAIFPELKKNLTRPDLLSIVSNTDKKDEITDVVIIELKQADGTITPEGAEGQLLKYSRYIHQSNLKNSVRIWTYAFLKYSDDTDEILRGDRGYNKIPTASEYPIYYQYFKNRNTIINFMDYRAIASDAYNRNKTFMKILNGKTL